VPNAAQFAANPFGVNVKPLDFSVADAPTTKTYHGASIVVNGNIVGRITTWQAAGAYTRGGEHVYELSHVTWGHPVDYVPGRVEGFTVALTRVEVWNQELEIAFGYRAVFENLTDQDRPFEVLEYLFRGQSLYRVWKYSGCWFQEKSPESYDANGNGICSVSATIAYVSRTRIQ